MKKIVSLVLSGVFLLCTPVSAEIKIGVAGPMTGGIASFGEQMKVGANFAVNDINANGGILGQKLTIVYGDDACEPKQAVSVANKMVSDEVVFVVGHFCSHSSIPASDIYSEENIIMMSPASTAVALTERSLPTVYRFVGRDDKQGRVAAEYIKKNFGKAKIAIVHDKLAYSQGLADQTKANLNNFGINEVFYDTVTSKETDFSSLVTKIKANKIDLLYYGGYHTEAGLIIRQMREQGLETKFFSGDALANNEFWPITKQYGQGTLMTFLPDPKKFPKAAEVINRMEKAGLVPEGYTIYTYGAIQTWAQAVEMAGTTDTTAVNNVLKTEEFDTLIGPIRFDEKGDFSAVGYAVYQWNNGTYEMLSQ